MWELSISFGYGVIALVLAYYSMNLDETHFWTRILFFCTSFLVLLQGVWSSYLILDAASVNDSLLSVINTAYWVLIWVYVLVLFYFFLYFLVSLITYIAKWRMKKREENTP
jgi:flagellar biosynthesis protein FlhB